jgi:hypothetical protein
MKKIYSLVACCLISIVLLQYRISYSDINQKPLKVTTWDALGYYIYLPSAFIYKDITGLKWFPDIDKKYAVSGGFFYQADKYKNDNYVFKYLGGVAIIETPFFLLGHWIAKSYNYETDGFSPPYQYAVSFGILFYCICAIFLLRHILLQYFSDITTAITLVLLILATNSIQYISIDTAMSHAPIFLLYVLVLYTTMKWHQSPKIYWAASTGYIIGLATICRPTEAIMLIIPLLWNTHIKELSKEKWALVKRHKKQIVCFVLFGFIGVLPQLIYWQIATGWFVYDVGSKWTFLNPFFRVLIGWEKGWFIYTPITIFFIIGLFFIKQYPFKRSVIYFCLLNIYIIISWYDWRYGASYSTRALVQSYPVFALPFAAFIEQLNLKKWRFVFYGLAIYLLFVNIFQVEQYNTTVLHYNDMNRQYYARIYLNSHPSPLDISLLDTDEFLREEDSYQKKVLVYIDHPQYLKSLSGSSDLLFETSIKTNEGEIYPENWLKIESEIKVSMGYWGSYLDSKLQVGDSVKFNRIRLFNPICEDGKTNKYAFYVKVPVYFREGLLKLYVHSENGFEGVAESVKITSLKK